MDSVHDLCDEEETEDFETKAERLNIRFCPCLGPRTYSHGVFHRRPPLRLPEPISVDEVRSRAEPMTRRVWANFELLKVVVERYEAVIQRRWEKKSKVKRRQVLNLAWNSTSSPPPPPMATMHRPDVHWLGQRCGRACHDHDHVPGEKKHFYMWPRLNLEDLGEAEPLLLLVNARGRHAPSTFALADLEPAWFGIKHETMPVPPFLDQYIMVFSGRDSAETYGELISWAEYPRAFARLYCGRDISPGEGLWVLEIQDRLYQFLVNACKNILHEVALEDRDGLLALPVQPEPPLPTANRSESGGGTSLLTTRNEAAYHVPAKLDIRRMQNLVASKLAEAEDALWALREDPSFFATALAEKYQCQPEHLLDTKGKPHPLLRTEAGRDGLMAAAFHDCWRHYVPAVEVWGTLHDRVARLAELKETLFDGPEIEVGTGNELPSELAMAFYTVLLHLQRIVRPLACHIFQEARMSPPVQHMFRRDPASDAAALRAPPESCRAVHLSGAKPSRELDAYMRILSDMEHPACRRDFGLHNLVEDMELVARDPATRRMIWPTVAASLSDVAIVGECTRQIELFQPWAATFPWAMASKDNAERIDAEWEETFRKLPVIGYKLSPETRRLAARLAHARYPVEKRPSRANVEAMRAAEAALDDFWEAALAELRRSRVLTARVGRVLEGARPERTPAWVETPRKVERRDPRAGDGGRDDVASSFGGLFIDARNEPCSVRAAEPRAKVKTRGVARPQPQPQPQPTGTERLAAARHERLEVDGRALAVFDALFHRPSQGARPGEVPWVEFTHAMHRVGFGVEKLGGSAWQFTPGASLAGRGGGYARGIQFHEPHPVAKIPCRTARRYGRRLARAYGWCAEAFALRDDAA